MNLNKKQQAILSVAVASTLNEGSGIELSDRELKGNEFAPCLSAKKSGGVIFNSALISPEIAKHLGFTFLPVIDAKGEESLGFFIYGDRGDGAKLTPLFNIDIRNAATLVGDLMTSALHLSDTTIASEVSSMVQEAVLACDMPLKEHLLANSTKALEQAFESATKARLEAQQKAFDATVKAIEANAEEKACKMMIKKIAELADIAATDRLHDRMERLNLVLPEVKALMEIAKK